MVFNFRGLFRFTYLWLSSSGWTPRRVAILVAFFFFFPLLEVLIWIGLLCDNIFFRDYRQERVTSPVFIIGNPRSGTTFLHRLLSKDVEKFTTMQMWEILLAPSITQRKIVQGLTALSQRFVAMLHRRLNGIEDRWQEQNVMHNVSLREPEEDDYLLLHIWSALTIGLSAGLLKEAIPYTYFDTSLPVSEKNRIMAFYKRCVQRHLHASRNFNGTGAKLYLAKNPALAPKIDTVFRHFPDAKIIYLARSPLEMIPSYVSMMEFSWQVLGIPAEGHDLRDYIIEMARHWYSYPLERLKTAPDDSHVIVKYDDLVGDPEETVRRIYERFGFEISPVFTRVLHEESARARHFRSRHRYVSEKLGLSRHQILTMFQDVFERFSFDTDAEDNQQKKA